MCANSRGCGETPMRDEQLDPLFRACFDSLPPRVRAQIEAGSPRAVKRLYGLYTLVRTGAPNRADRRKAQR